MLNDEDENMTLMMTMMVGTRGVIRIAKKYTAGKKIWEKEENQN